MADFKNCDPCFLDRQNSTAISFCVVCVEYLCETCNRDHQRNKMTRAHKILTNGELPKDATVFHKMNELLSCRRHPHDKVSFRCLDHDELICITCCAVNHRKCEHVEELTKCQVNRELSQKLDSIGETVKSVKSLKTANLEQMRLERENVEKERVEFIKSLTDKINKLDAESKTETEILVMPYLLELQNDILKCQELEEKANFNKELLEITTKYGKEADLTVISCFVEKNIDKFERDSQEQKTITGDYLKIKFQKNSVLADAAEIGKFTLEEAPYHLYSLHRSSDELSERKVTYATVASASSQTNALNPTMQVDKGELMDWKPQKYFQGIIRSSSDKETCCVNAMLLLPSGHLLVTDRSNQNIKVFTNSLQFAYKRSLDSEPVDICQIESLETGHEHVAAIEDNTRRVKAFSVSESCMTMYKEFCTKLQSLSIAMFSGPYVLILSSEKPPSYTGERETLQVDIRDMRDGQVMQKFNIKELFGDGFDMETRRIHYTSRKAIIIPERKRIHCLKKENEKLNEIWFYKCYGKNNLEVVSDIDSDEEGNVYICGKVSENVHQVSAATYKNNRIIIPKIKDPSAICVDSRNGRIIMGTENDDNIHVFLMGK